LKVNRKLEYALIALRHISLKQGQLCSAKEIASTYALPFDVISRVLQKLSQFEWLKSSQGSNGGYFLGNKDFSELSLLELVEILDGQHAVVKCLLKNHDCPISSKCNVINPMEKLNNNLQTFLSQQKVVDLFEQQMAAAMQVEVANV